MTPHQLLELLPEEYKEMYKENFNTFLISQCSERTEYIHDVIFFSTNVPGSDCEMTSVYRVLLNHEFTCHNELM